MPDDVKIRAAGRADEDALWSMLEPVFRSGDTYAIDPGISRAAALDYWCAAPHRAFIAEAGGEPLGTYFLTPNQQGGGAHVCNCGFVTAPAARGRGLARAMLEHALQAARAAGFRAMQFNFVVETNTRAIAIWSSYGFDVAGRLPGAFRHPEKGFVDALVMYKHL
ncbi:GNAT family N-acetyltransferase [Maritimibacter sp. 55A14]|uniref:GNAT family N-acetyltransferase n=1 Tax=Maritimibacter sp. 55A14 TaxID=2174844 RepID=UPI000D619965|nr:GNAT family N-acetyltransferase [Maritimibacter sp. 55A14]PWE29305.1 GNAT family N-acetyltransferase [Maritimibacter sp. 55A14]